MKHTIFALLLAAVCSTAHAAEPTVYFNGQVAVTTTIAQDRIADVLDYVVQHYNNAFDLQYYKDDNSFMITIKGELPASVLAEFLSLVVTAQPTTNQGIKVLVIGED